LEMESIMTCKQRVHPSGAVKSGNVVNHNQNCVKDMI